MKEGSAFIKRSVRPLLIMQFFDAFNDNAFKIIVALLAIRTLSSLQHSTEFVTLIGLIFTVPFIVFSPLAGYLVDKYSRRTVIVGAKLIEILSLFLGVGVLAGGSWPHMCAIVFLLASQSVIFSTAKYALLADILDEREISRGNGLLQMAMFLGILGGTAFGGYALKFFSAQFWQIGLILISFAFIGLLNALRLPHRKAPEAEEAVRIRSASDIRRVLHDITRARPLYMALWGLAFFWFIAAVFQINILL